MMTTMMTAMGVATETEDDKGLAGRVMEEIKKRDNSRNLTTVSTKLERKRQIAWRQ